MGHAMCFAKRPLGCTPGALQLAGPTLGILVQYIARRVSTPTLQVDSSFLVSVCKTADRADNCTDQSAVTLPLAQRKEAFLLL